MRQAVQHRGAKLLGAAFGLDAAFVGEGPVAVEGDGNQRGDSVVGERAGLAPHHQAAHRHRPQSHNPAHHPGREVVVRGFKVVDVLRQFQRVQAPDSGLVDLVQIRIEYRHRLQRENLMHQFGQLRSRLLVKIQLQRAPRELVEVVHLAAPGLGCPGVVRDARGEPAHHQRHQNECQQSDGVGRISRRIRLRLARREIAMHHNCRQRHNDCLPESRQQGRGNHNQQVEKHGHRKQPLRPMGKRRYQDHGHNPQRTLQREQERARAPGPQGGTHWNVASGQPAKPLSIPAGFKENPPEECIHLYGKSAVFAVSYPCRGYFRCRGAIPIKNALLHLCEEGVDEF